MDPVYLIYVGLFLGTLLLVEGLYYLYFDRAGVRRQVNRRMRMLAAGMPSSDIYKKLRRASSFSRDPGAASPGVAGWLGRLVAQSGMQLTLARLVTIMVGLSLGVFAVVFVLAASHPTLLASPFRVALAVLASLAFGAGGPIVFLRRARAARLKLFSEQLPDALEMMVRSLRAGHPVAVAIGLAAKQMADPIGTELGMVIDEMTYGLDLREALEKMGERVGLDDFQFVVVAIGIQSETGGNLAEVLENLATIIRARFRMFKKVRALSAEGRFSAKILGFLPFAFVLLTYTTRPNYYLNVVDDPLFLPGVGVAVVLQIAGIAIMQRMINFKM